MVEDNHSQVNRVVPFKVRKLYLIVVCTLWMVKSGFLGSTDTSLVKPCPLIYNTSCHVIAGLLVYFQNLSCVHVLCCVYWRTFAT